MIDSYFKVATPLYSKEERFSSRAPLEPVIGVYTFDSQDRDSALRAFELAASLKKETAKSSLSMWRAPAMHGPWDGLDLVGESRSDIELELVRGAA